MTKKSKYSGITFLNQDLNRTLHHLDERMWGSPCPSGFCVRIKIREASSRCAISNGRERRQFGWSSLQRDLLLEDVLWAAQLGSRLIFSRLGRRQCRCSSPLEPFWLSCCVLWSWTWSSELWTYKGDPVPWPVASVLAQVELLHWWDGVGLSALSYNNQHVVLQYCRLQLSIKLLWGFLSLSSSRLLVLGAAFSYLQLAYQTAISAEHVTPWQGQ